MLGPYLSFYRRSCWISLNLATSVTATRGESFDWLVCFDAVCTSSRFTVDFHCLKMARCIVQPFVESMFLLLGNTANREKKNGRSVIIRADVTLPTKNQFETLMDTSGCKWQVSWPNSQSWKRGLHQETYRESQINQGEIGQHINGKWSQNGRSIYQAMHTKVLMIGAMIKQHKWRNKKRYDVSIL